MTTNTTISAPTQMSLQLITCSNSTSNTACNNVLAALRALQALPLNNSSYIQNAENIMQMEIQISNLQDSIATKVNQTELNDLSNAISGNQQCQSIAAQIKASNSANTTDPVISKLEQQIAALTTALEQKANLNDFQLLNNAVLADQPCVDLVNLFSNTTTTTDGLQQDITALNNTVSLLADQTSFATVASNIYGATESLMLNKGVISNNQTSWTIGQGLPQDQLLYGAVLQPYTVTPSFSTIMNNNHLAFNFPTASSFSFSNPLDCTTSGQGLTNTTITLTYSDLTTSTMTLSCPQPLITPVTGAGGCSAWSIGDKTTGENAGNYCDNLLYIATSNINLNADNPLPFELPFIDPSFTLYGFYNDPTSSTCGTGNANVMVGVMNNAITVPVHAYFC